MNAFRFGFFSAALGVLLSTNAQTWKLPGNQITLPTQYLGCNALSTSPLQLITVPRLSIDFYTENRMRWQLLPTANYTVGSFPGVNATGYGLMSPSIAQFYGNGAPGPFSLLHLAAANNNTQSGSYRIWMDVGISMTGNNDHNYFGQKAKAELDYTDVVIHWSDNP